MSSLNAIRETADIGHALDRFIGSAVPNGCRLTLVAPGGSGALADAVWRRLASLRDAGIGVDVIVDRIDATRLGAFQACYAARPQLGEIATVKLKRGSRIFGQLSFGEQLWSDGNDRHPGAVLLAGPGCANNRIVRGAGCIAFEMLQAVSLPVRNGVYPAQRMFGWFAISKNSRGFVIA